MVRRAGLGWAGTCCIGGCVEGLEKACLADDIGLAGGGAISDAILMVVQAAGTLYTFDRGTKRLSKAD